MANNRPKMDRADRAKQFMPFDALKGFREALAEKERLAEEQKGGCKKSILRYNEQELKIGEHTEVAESKLIGLDP